MEWIVLLLVVYLIFKDSGIKPFWKQEEPKNDISEDEKEKIRQRKEQFDELMEYNMDKAIDSKRSE